jgi:hypothetical protein
MIITVYDPVDAEWSFVNKPVINVVPIQGKTSIYQIMLKNNGLRNINESFIRMGIGGILEIAFIDNDKIADVEAIITDAINNFRRSVIIPDDLITIVKFFRDTHYTTFPEKTAKEQQLKAGAKETLLEHLNIEKQLNIELI